MQQLSKVTISGIKAKEEEVMTVAELIKDLEHLLGQILSDLNKVKKGNRSASQRVRTNTIKLAKLAKIYRKESIAEEKSKKKKGKIIMKRKTRKKAAKSAAPKRKRKRKSTAKTTKHKRRRKSTKKSTASPKRRRRRKTASK